LNLRLKPGLAGVHLGRSGSFVNPAFAALFKLEMFDRIRDVYLGTIDSCVLQSSIEEMAGRSDERAALLILLVSGLLADKNDPRRAGSLSKDRLGGATVKVASLAPLNRIVQNVQAPRVRNEGLSPPTKSSFGMPLIILPLSHAIEPPGPETLGLRQESTGWELMSVNASDVLIETLLAWGVDVVFGLPGDGINGIMEAFRKRQDAIRFIQVRPEESAAFIACGYAKHTGRLGCCLATWTRS
jgi:hypothetical protein